MQAEGSQRMKIRQRTKNLLVAGGIGACIMLLISSGITYFAYTQYDKSTQEKLTAVQLQLKEAEALLDDQQSQRTYVYVLNQDIEAGTEITSEMLERYDLPSYLLPDNIVEQSDAVGKITKIDMKKNTPLTEAMLFTNGRLPKDLRHVEFNFIDLPTKLEKGKYVDVRIAFPTGHDYIVLAKKKVEDLVNQTVWHELNELEILTVRNATVDAYFENATIYALEYIDPYMQDSAVVSYPVKQEIVELIESNPNIVNVAISELEKRNRQKLERDLQALDQSKKNEFSLNQAEQQRQAQQNRLNPVYEPPRESMAPSYPQEPSYTDSPDMIAPIESEGTTLEDKLSIFENDSDNSVPVSP